jgi:hypothetical protein
MPWLTVKSPALDGDQIEAAVFRLLESSLSAI